MSIISQLKKDIMKDSNEHRAALNMDVFEATIS